MSFKDKKPNTIPEGYYYNASEIDEYLAIVEPKAEKLDELFPNSHIIEETGGTMCELLIEQAGKLESIKDVVKEFEYPHPFLRGDHNDWLNRLRKILGIEEAS